MSRNLVLRVASYASLGSAILAITALVGFIVVVGSGTISQGARSAGFFVPTGAALSSVLLLGIALVGLFLYQEARLGPRGVVAFVIALVGTMLAAGAQWTYVFVVPYFSDSVPELIDESSGVVLVGFVLSYALLALGWVSFGIATLKAGVLPRRGAIAMIAGAAISFLPLPSRTLVLTLAVAYLGGALRRDTGLPHTDHPTAQMSG